MALSYRMAGTPGQPVVLFLHGFMGDGSVWDAVVEGLRRRVRCVAVDLPGHGASVGLAEDAYTVEGVVAGLEAVLDEVDAQQAAVVGYSMGGRLALAFALERPARCSRLVLESASPGLPTEAARAARRQEDEARAQRLETDDFDAFLHDWYRQPLFATLATRPDLLAQVVATRRRNDPAELARSLRGLGTGVQPSYWDRLASLQMPTLAVAGAQDGKYVDIARRMALYAPRLRAVTMPNSGHNVHAEHPAAFLDVLADFLRSL